MLGRHYPSEGKEVATNPARAIVPAAVPTMVVTCPVHTERFAVVSGVGVAALCIYNDALNPAKTLFGIAMIFI